MKVRDPGDRGWGWGLLSRLQLKAKMIRPSAAGLEVDHSGKVPHPQCYSANVLLAVKQSWRGCGTEGGGSDLEDHLESLEVH